MSIIYDEIKRKFTLETGHSTYQMRVDALGILRHCYYGRKVYGADMSYLSCPAGRSFSGSPYESTEDRNLSFDLLPQEYSGSGMGDYRVPSIEVCAENGSRSVDFRYEGYKIYHGKYKLSGLPCVREDENTDTLEIHLFDETLGLSLTLFYGVYEKEDVITRAVRLENRGSGSLTLQKAASVTLDFPNGQFDLIHFHGKHCMERQAERIRLPKTLVSTGSTRGMSSHQHNPFVILCHPETGENSGEAYGVMLMYSGNHKEEIETDQTGSVRVTAGIHDAGFSWRLDQGKMFYAPETILSFSAEGLNGLSQNYHRMIRNHVCHPKYLHRKRPVLLNTWEAHYFDFTEGSILQTAKSAAELGIDLLVLDDGWFGKRDDDCTSLGDWTVYEKKLPGGLKYLAEQVNAFGMGFGLWFEPEMISEESRLFREHPEWVLCEPDRKPVLSRNQLVLDMSRQDVQDYLYDCFAKILSGVNIQYIKWDMNRCLANVFSNLLPADQQGETAHRFVLGTYALLERLTIDFPDVMIEGCAGGGGRFDAGILYYCPQIWCSDDTDPIERLEIQRGTSYGYPVSTMGSHVSASPNHQTGRESGLETRGVVAMSGTFGFELDPEKLTEEERKQIKDQIGRFHELDDLIREGRYYRLIVEGYEEDASAWQFVSEDRKESLVCVVFKTVRANPETPVIKLCGLKDEEVYSDESGEKYSGAALMYGGLLEKLPFGNYPAHTFYLKMDVVES